MSSDLIDGDFRALQKRKITEETCRRFGYRVGKFKGQTVQLADYRDDDDNVVAQKIRFSEKDKGMPWLGEGKKPKLFGQHLPLKSKRMLVITEGEIDALTMSQVQGNKWPVVSVPLGAKTAAQAIKRELAWVSQFETVVFMFDMDDPGKEAAKECAALLPPGKAKIAKLPLKDPSDMLMAGRGPELIDAMWTAEHWRPDGIVSGQGIKDRLKNRPEVICYPYPDDMDQLQFKTLGLRMAEVTTWTSGSGMGKTTVIKQLQHHFWKTTDFNQAIIHLEEPLEDTAEELVGIHLGKRLKLPEVRETLVEGEKDAASDELFDSVDENGTPRFNLYDAFGSMGDDDNLYGKIRYFATALDCKIVWLDHLSILVSSMGDDGDERRRIDSIMHNLATLAVELNIHIGLISHLKKADGKVSFEEGAVPTLDDLRGSGGIKQLSWNVIALARDQQATNPAARNTSGLHCLKCRYTGRTGPAGHLFFNDLTGRMEKGSDPDLMGEFTDETDDGPEEGKEF